MSDKPILGSTPVVSVVLSVFNGERFLRDALNSILEQSFTDFEFIIIDDGSTDSTRHILQEYECRDGRIRIFQQENRGLIASLNRGCELARGRYIARMDGDDVALPDRLERQIAFLEEHPEIAVLGGVVEFIDAAGRTVGCSASVTSPAKTGATLLDANVLWHPTVVMRHEAFVAVGGYRDVRAAEDYDLWLRMADCSFLTNLPHAILRYRLHSGQTTETENPQMIVSALAARAAAFARRSGLPDPLDGAHQINATTIAALIRSVRPMTTMDALRGGETEAEASLLRSYFRWLLQAAEVDDECLNGAIQVLESPYWRQAKRPYFAEACYTAARLQLWKGNYLLMLSAAMKASWSCPSILGRAFNPWRRVFLRKDRYEGARRRALRLPV